MGNTYESLFNTEKEKSKIKNNKNGVTEKTNPKNKGPNLFCAPVDASTNNDNIYINSSNVSQATMTIDQSHYQINQKPQVYQYVNKYKSNGLQKSIAKASLIELGGPGNSLMISNIKKNPKDNTLTVNSLYSNIDDTGYESSYDGVEMIIDGKMDEDLVQKSKDKNTINNYKEFIQKKGDINHLGNQKIMDYSKRNAINQNLKTIPEDNIEGDELSRIPSDTINKQIKSNNNIQNYIQYMGKY